MAQDKPLPDPPNKPDDVPKGPPIQTEDGGHGPPSPPNPPKPGDQ